MLDVAREIDTVVHVGDLRLHARKELDRVRAGDDAVGAAHHQPVDESIGPARLTVGFDIGAVHRHDRWHPQQARGDDEVNEIRVEDRRSAPGRDAGSARWHARLVVETVTDVVAVDPGDK